MAYWCQPSECWPLDFQTGIVACAADVRLFPLSSPSRLTSPLQLPAADIEVLSGTITALGGQWRQAYTRDVTHLFALTPTSDRYLTALHHQRATRVCILAPHWFDDTYLLQRRVSEEDYEWPDP